MRINKRVFVQQKPVGNFSPTGWQTQRLESYQSMDNVDINQSVSAYKNEKVVILIHFLIIFRGQGKTCGVYKRA